MIIAKGKRADGVTAVFIGVTKQEIDDMVQHGGMNLSPETGGTHWPKDFAMSLIAEADDVSLMQRMLILGGPNARLVDAYSGEAVRTDA